MTTTPQQHPKRKAGDPIPLGSPPGSPLTTIGAQIRERTQRIERLKQRHDTCSLETLRIEGPEMERGMQILQAEIEDLRRQRVRIELGIPELAKAEPAATSVRTTAVQAPPAVKKTARDRPAADLDALGEDLADAIQEWVKREIAAAIEPLAATVKAVDARCGPGAGLRYRGIWQRAQDYAQGSVVTHDGSGWVALRDVGEGAVPGHSPDGWQLFVKRGSDAPERRQ